MITVIAFLLNLIKQDTLGYPKLYPNLMYSHILTHDNWPFKKAYNVVQLSLDNKRPSLLAKIDLSLRKSLCTEIISLDQMISPCHKPWDVEEDSRY